MHTIVNKSKKQHAEAEAHSRYPLTGGDNETDDNGGYQLLYTITTDSVDVLTKKLNIFCHHKN